ncbi:stearoyl-CoA 9-desaturase [Marasmius crinis-equi]|uniref:Acyl-CoA desaturase n=1 Tax=Marasmius crinis-equi TaxID=585013 RepID=A0ABR3F3F2_9AGAR
MLDVQEIKLKAAIFKKFSSYKQEPVPEPENYVDYILKTTKPLPPITWSNLLNEIQWISVVLIFVPPIVGIIGARHVSLRWETFVWSVMYYLCTGIGITAGYHRLWAHRSYNAPLPTQIILACFGAGAAQGSIKWWSRGHRAHHRYTDTDLDPYNAHKGFWYSHIGWMLVRPRRRPGVADVSDLGRSAVVRWQHEWYLGVMLGMAFGFPALVAGVGWGDVWGGFVYAGVLRLVFVHHSTFCVNSLAHWLGETPYDDKHTPKDHMITAFVTCGEGYHNFHHQTFPDNEIRKGVLSMQLKKLKETQDSLAWPSDSNDLPIVTWETFQNQSRKRPLVLIAGFIHDMSKFVEDHPGGAHLIKKFIGKDATTAFFGGVYDHSNAAHNLLAMKRVGILNGGHPHALDDKTVPPASRLKIAKYAELNSTASYGSTTACSDSED